MSQTPTPLSTAKPFLTEGLIENPYPTYKRLLEEGPIHCLDFRGRVFWALVSYADCSTVLRDLRFSADERTLCWGPFQRSDGVNMRSLPVY